MVSVIVVVYNLEDLIKRSIESVLNQSYKDVELIIVNDGSTDETGACCMEYAKQDKRIIYIEKKNEGQGTARNMGVAVATGDYVTFLDGDDWLESNAIEKMHECAEIHNVDIVVGDIWYVYEYGGELEKRYSKIRYEDNQVLEKGEDFGKISKLRTFTWGKLYKRSFLKKVGFCQPTYAYEDTATIPTLVALADKIAYINTPVYNYLKNRQGSTIHRKEKALDLSWALQHVCDSFERRDLWEVYREELARLCLGQVRSLCIQHGVSWEQLRDEESLYHRLYLFIRERFPKIQFLENYTITVVNSTLLYEGLKNILFDASNIVKIVDEVEQNCRIEKSDGLHLWMDSFSSVYKTEQYNEDQLWDCADYLFHYFYGEK